MKLVFSTSCSELTSGQSCDHAMGYWKWTLRLGEELTGQRRRDTPGREGTKMCRAVCRDARDVLDERINPRRTKPTEGIPWGGGSLGNPIRRGLRGSEDTGFW